jgi:riboflavin kinase/FMN adenylyltransferase
MRIHSTFDAPAGLRPGDFRSPVATLGVFDGVHVGHRHVLALVRERARRTRGDAVVITFADHPDALLKGEAPPLLTPLPLRLKLFAACGIDHAVVLPFDDAVRSLSPEEFVLRVLVRGIGVKSVVLGYNSRFGKDAAGDFETLRALGHRHGFEAELAGPVLSAGAEVSSTALRRAIIEGRLADAEAWLGRPPSVYGRVARGASRGRLIGFPTANVEAASVVKPPRGVYAGRVEVGGITYPALVNIGTRPTFENAGGLLVEAHLVGFSGDLYGREIDVQILGRVRDERRFAGPDELRAQIERDRDVCLRIVAERAGGEGPAQPSIDSPECGDIKTVRRTTDTGR